MNNVKQFTLIFKLFIVTSFIFAVLNSSLLSAQTTSSKKVSTKSFEWLTSQQPIENFLPTSQFIENVERVSKQKMTPLIEGKIKISSINNTVKIKIHKDSYKISDNKLLQAKQPPELSFNIVQHQQTIIPTITSVQRSNHPNWEWQVSPGKIWKETLDQGYFRIVFPFSLQEKNANCTHNGLLLIFINAKGESKNGIFQIASETCSYFQFDLAGRVKVTFNKKNLDNRKTIVEQFVQQLKNKAKVYNTDQLKKDHPQLDLKKLMPFSVNQSTTSGVVIKGKHYRLNCETRYGSYPYCKWLALPSYSTAKSIFAGLGLMRLKAIVPKINQILVSKIIPECNQEKWNGVTLDDLVNMRTGNYISRDPHKDESSKLMLSFFLAPSHQQKLKLACESFPKKSTAGKRFNYHTSDTYIAGVMLNRLYQKMTGEKDFYQDILVDELWQALNLSPLMQQTKRTYDSSQQAFTGWGLTYYIDDIIKLTHFLHQQKNSSQWLDQTLLGSAMQFGDNRINRAGGEDNVAYNYGFWGLQVAQSLSCKKTKWIPFMSGFGGITIAMPSEDLLYYNFSDHYRYQWLEKIVALNQRFPICENS